MLHRLPLIYLSIYATFSEANSCVLTGLGFLRGMEVNSSRKTVEFISAGASHSVALLCMSLPPPVCISLLCLVILTTSASSSCESSSNSLASLSCSIQKPRERFGFGPRMKSPEAFLCDMLLLNDFLNVDHAFECSTAYIFRCSSCGALNLLPSFLRKVPFCFQFSFKVLVCSLSLTDEF